jgi:hypothetical protein
MAQTGYSKVQIYSSSTATNTPSAGNLTNDTNGSELSINITDGKLFYKDNSGTVQVIASKASNIGNFASLTSAITLPAGTTAQEPTGVQGMLRFNTTTSQFEGYNGSAWASVGGAAISNDTATATTVYPLFSHATSGTALTVYTSNANYLYTPSTGLLQAPNVASTNGITINGKTISSNVTIATGQNGFSVGPTTLNSGVTLTIASGSRWVEI